MKPHERAGAAGAAAEPVVLTRGLTKRFGAKTAVDNLDLAVDPGEFFGFLGPNGAGKTTTIRMLTGVLRPSSGTARVAGADVGEEPERVKQAIGVLPEGLNLYQRLTAREHVQFVGAMYGLAPDVAAARSEELLDLMDLEADADKLIVDYSQGMRKKTALAAALIHAPRVLFLDEPFEGIDAITVRAIRTVLQRLASRGTTIFFSSHILDVVERLCTRVAVIASGRLVAEGSIETLRHQAKAGAHATLEEIFMQAVGAESEEATQRGLSWLD